MNGRALKQEFFEEFLNGKYKSIVEIVKKDPALTLFLRGNYVTIYYKSLQILKITINGKYHVDAGYGITLPRDDKKWEEYFKNAGYKTQPTDEEKWTKYFKDAKEKIDEHNRMEKTEKSVQQAIVQENNRGKLCKETQYFIIDIEYTQSGFQERFDALAAYWPNNARQTGEDLQLAFIEIKAGQDAISSKFKVNENQEEVPTAPGVYKHWESVKAFIEKLDDNKERDAFLSDMEKMAGQLISLGLWDIGSDKKIKFLRKMKPCLPRLSDIGSDKKIKFSRTKKPQLIFILVNYNPKSRVLDKEVSKIMEKNAPFETLFAASSFMGYGLYDKCMLTLESVKERIVKE